METATRKKRKKIRRITPAEQKVRNEPLKEALITYADIETAFPEDDPIFWYAQIKNSETGERFNATDFKPFWQKLIEKPKGRQKLVGFYNADYDMGVLGYHAFHELGYKINPCEYYPHKHSSQEYGNNARINRIEGKYGITTQRPSCVLYNTFLKDGLGAHKYAKASRNGEIRTIKGLPYTIYEGQVYEIYEANVLQPIVRVFDTMPSMTGGIESWGEILGKPKGDPPKNNTGPDLPVRKEDWQYVDRDVDIQEEVYELLGNDEQLRKGNLTEASMAQYDLKERKNRIEQGENYTERTRGMPTRFNARRESVNKDPKPLPSSVKSAISSEIEAFKQREYMKSWSEKEEKPNYLTAETVFKEAEDKLRRYYAKRLKQVEGKTFTEGQKLAHKKLKGKRLTKTQKEEVKRFYELDLPKDTSSKPDLDEIADSYHRKMLLAAVNTRIHPAMKGGISTPNWEYANQILGEGMTVDANSMYPSILYYLEIPRIYKGMQEKGEPNTEKYFVVQVIELKATIKEGYHPWVKGSTRFDANEKFYRKTVEWEGKGKYALTSVEYKYLFETYDVEHIKLGKTFYYEADDAFTQAIREYIAEWQEVKLEADREKVPYEKKMEQGETLTPEEAVEYNQIIFKRKRAKMRLNTLWGRWGMFSKNVSQGAETVDIGDKQTDLVSAVFTTAYARIWLNRVSNSVGSSFAYSDTDSVHLIYKEDGIKSEEHMYEVLGSIIDASAFGYWEPEEKFKRAKYIRAKSYALELPTGEIKATVAGAKGGLNLESLEEFYIGNSFKTTKSTKDIFGRTKIKETEFTIKDVV